MWFKRKKKECPSEAVCAWEFNGNLYPSPEAREDARKKWVMHEMKEKVHNTLQQYMPSYGISSTVAKEYDEHGRPETTPDGTYIFRERMSLWDLTEVLCSNKHGIVDILKRIKEETEEELNDKDNG